jgi:hypothetical protein
MKPLIVRRYRLQIDYAGQIRRRCERGPLCGAQGCDNFGNPCWLPDDIYGEPSCYYCWAHMYDQGFCPACGNFWAGVESFDFSRSGLCENCHGQGNYDDDYSDYWEDDWMDWDDLPHMQVMQ